MNIYIANLSYRVEESDLKELFGQFGAIVSTKVMIDNQTGRSKCFGFVNMADRESMQNAINKLNRTMYDGKIISVSESRTREDKPARSFYSGNADRRRNSKSSYGDKQEKS